MRWLASAAAAALQLLCLVDLATAIPNYDPLQSKRLTGRQEALLLFKRQSSTCPTGYFQCPIEFGGGCCANGRICATINCPAGNPPMQPMPNPSASAQQQPTQAPPTTTTQPQPTTAPPSQPTTTEAPPPPSSTDADAATSTQPSAPSSSDASDTDTSSPTGTATDVADAAATTTDPAAAGTLYAPNGISSGAIVGIVFAGITGAVIVGLVLWRAIIGIKNPKKGKRPMASRGAGGGAGGFLGGLKNPFAKKQAPPTGAAQSMMQHHQHDQAPMSQTAAAMGFGPHNGGGEGVPPYMQDRSSLDDHDTSYNNNRGFQGGDLGYRSVESFDRDDANQGLFHR
ncbi:hypothetical protein AA313_de0203894 [Arthrobotrys entomopaga]|nr:hypothetical protein AA313_de0203894 [Arthrobotrys entomopaga]